MTKTILVLAANPKDTSRLRLDQEVREIDEGLRRSKLRDRFTILPKLAVCLRDLRRAMLDYEPQIVHFCGHGGEHGLLVEDEHGNAVPVDTDALAGLFELFKKQVECVLLNACYSQTQAEAIGKHINYVVGMSQGITDKASIEFSVGFYDALGAGRSFDEAFKFGCNAIQWHNLPEHLTPILKQSPMVGQIQELERPPRKAGHKVVVFDQGHNQEKWDWGGSPPIIEKYGYSRVEKVSRGQFQVRSIISSITESGAIKDCDVLVIVSPYHAFLQPVEIKTIDSFVENGGGLLLLGFEFSDKHHHNNLSTLSKQYGIQFNYDRIVDEEQYYENPLHPLVETTGLQNSEFFRKVRRICFPLSCSLHVSKGAKVVLRAGRNAFTETPTLVENQVIKSLKRTLYTDVTIIASALHGSGKVVAIGTWEILLTKYMEDEYLDNDRFYLNALEWLSS